MKTSHRYQILAAAAALVAVAACKDGDAKTDDTAKTDNTVQIGPDQIAFITTQQIRSGPSLSGSLDAETQATVRAEIAGAVLSTMTDAGQAVRAGQELARIDDATIRDQVLSAQSGVTTANNAVQLAEREVSRAEALAKAGAIPERQLELAKNQLTGAQAQQADARARLTMAQKQQEKTTVRAPFNGVVSVKQANAGDFVSPGSAMFTIISPGTMRLEASVPADALAAIRIGAPVEFVVNGYPNRKFVGRISAVNPAADPTTRQVRVTVTIPNTGGTLVSGLFAEGRVTAETHVASVAPAAAVDESGVRPWLLRVKNGMTDRVEVELGTRDPETETVEIIKGVSPGDTVLLGTARGLTPKVPVKVSKPSDK